MSSIDINNRSFGEGDRVRTLRGAHFRGVVLTIFMTRSRQLRCVVEAVEDGFEGTCHIYSLDALRLDT